MVSRLGGYSIPVATRELGGLYGEFVDAIPVGRKQKGESRRRQHRSRNRTTDEMNGVMEGSPQRTGRMSLTQKTKAEVLPPRNAMALDTLTGVRGEMARLYRLALNGRIRSDEMTRFIYALKEIRACLEAETLIDVQQRLAALTRDMGNHNGHRVHHQPTFPRS